MKKRKIKEWRAWRVRLTALILTLVLCITLAPLIVSADEAVPQICSHNDCLNSPRWRCGQLCRGCATPVICGNCDKCDYTPPQPHECDCCEICGYCGEDDCEICNPPPPCDCNNCDVCGFKGGKYGLGNVTGSDAPSMADALAVLRYLVKLSSPIHDDENAYIAARIVSPENGGDPIMADALQILRKIVKLLNKIDVPNLDTVHRQEPLSLKLDESLTLTPNYEGASFRSLNESVATVETSDYADDEFIVTAVRNGGIAYILEELDGEIVVLHTVNVIAFTTEINIRPFPEYISVWESHKIDVTLEPFNSADPIEYSVSNDCGYINHDGVFHAQKRGSVVVTVKSGEVTKSFIVTVESPHMSRSEMMIVEGKIERSLKLEDTKRAVTWKSSNTRVATVNANGDITAKKAGYTCIIAKVGNTEYFTDVQVITELEKKMSDLQKRYPHGYFWNKNTPSKDYPSVSVTPCDHTRDNPRKCYGQCAGFANMLSDLVFGSNAPRYNVPNVNSVRQGDYVRYSRQPGHNHSIIIMRVVKKGEIIGYNRWSREHITADETYWIVTDCNWWSNCVIEWYRYFNIERFVTTFNAVESYRRIK
ncbi:MAG: Ig-like domain-containing protein [Oscillospiraceae bacterium]|nr:Ig-like domain-containing protein [Oscillospiraceae bacterium]